MGIRAIWKVESRKKYCASRRCTLYTQSSSGKHWNRHLCALLISKLAGCPHLQKCDFNISRFSHHSRFIKVARAGDARKIYTLAYAFSTVVHRSLWISIYTSVQAQLINLPNERRLVCLTSVRANLDKKQNIVDLWFRLVISATHQNQRD